MSIWQSVCRAEDLKDGAFVEFRLDGETDAPGGFVFRHQDKVLAYRNQCPHLGVELNWLPGRFLDLDGCFLQCATHGALFTPESGHCVAGPCQGDALTPLAVRISDQGDVLINSDR